MSLFTLTKKAQTKVHSSQYIRTENEEKPKEGETKPTEKENLVTGEQNNTPNAPQIIAGLILNN